jgi:hypothetical protein
VHSKTIPQLFYDKWVSGVKICSCDLYDTEQIDTIAGFPTIVSYRHNKLSQIISRQLAMRAKKWLHVPYADEKMYLDLRSAQRVIDYFLRVEEAVREKLPDALWIEYGEMCSGSGIIKAQKHLGLRVMDLPIVIPKQSKGANIEYVSNVDELLKSPLAGWV